MASVAVMGNDALQTLGPFLASQGGRGNRIGQGLVLAGVLCAVLLGSWAAGAGDPAWGRLDHFPLPDPFLWRDLVPLVALLGLTRLGIPVSTSFLVLTAMAPPQLGAMARKSLAGYGVAFVVGGVAYGLLGPWLEGPRALSSSGPAGSPTPTAPAALAIPLAPAAPPTPRASRWGGAIPWRVLRWLATLALWSQWLVQDLANIYVYLPRRLSLAELLATLVVLCGAVALVVALGGGPLQGRLRSKTPLEEARATTVVSLLQGLVLVAFLGGDRLPMSTSWLFLGLLAGREVGLACRGRGGEAPAVARDLTLDLLRAGAGLATSLAVALLVAGDRA
ncbi:MAG: hypothetical protein VKP70_08720 [Cyanobacteriota bacterium]|nr:hypothetical protein [Cyanobacteriota bacterium]